MNWPEVKKVNSDLNVPLNEGGVKIVKSVQRGSIAPGASASYSDDNYLSVNTDDLRSWYIDITINKVNLSKASVSIKKYSDYYSSTTNPIPLLIDEDTLRIYFYSTNANQSAVKVSHRIVWEVIEFY